MQLDLADCTLQMVVSLYVASVTQHNATMPAGPRETKISEQDRA